MFEFFIDHRKSSLGRILMHQNFISVYTKITGINELFVKKMYERHTKYACFANRGCIVDVCIVGNHWKLDYIIYFLSWVCLFLPITGSKFELSCNNSCVSMVLFWITTSHSSKASSKK